MAVFNNQLAGAAGQGGADAAYQIERSLRFDEDATAFLERTPSSAGNRRTWTWSGWVKRSSEGYNFLLLAYQANPYIESAIAFSPDDEIYVYNYSSGGFNGQVTTNAVFRDYSAWYHIVVVYDTTDVTPVKIYVNGEQQSTTGTQPTSNSESTVNHTTSHKIGRYEGSTTLSLDGYLADVHFIDGQALTADDFGEPDDNGVWQPKEYTFSTPKTVEVGTPAYPSDFTSTGNKTSDQTGLSFSSWSGSYTGAATKIFKASDDSVFNLSLSLVGGSTDRYLWYSDNLTDWTYIGNTNPNRYYLLSGHKYYATSEGSGSTTIYANPDGATSFHLDFSDNSSAAALGTDTSGNSNTWTVNNLTAVVDNNRYSQTTTGTAPTPLNSNNQYIGAFDGTTSTAFYFNTGTWAMDWSSLPSSTTVSSSLRIYCYPRNGTLTVNINGSNVASITGNTETWRTVSFTGTINSISFNGTDTYSGVSAIEVDGSILTDYQITGAANDSLIDTPTNYESESGNARGNYATLNPLTATDQYALITNGNLDFNVTTGTTWSSAMSTMAFKSEKIYFEYGVTTTSPNSGVSGAGAFVAVRKLDNQASWAISGADNYTLRLGDTGYLRNGTGSNTLVTNANPAVGDIFGFAIDGTNGTYAIYENGTQISSGSLSLSGYTAGDTLIPWVGKYPNIGNVTYGCFSNFNFGQRPFVYPPGSSGGPSSDYKSLCTTNLTDPTIKDGSTAMDVVLYTGNESTQSVTGLDFQPDFVWIKPRNQLNEHVLVDAVRGAGYRLFSNQTNAENYQATSLTSFDSNGFSLGSHTSVNKSSINYVGWTWDGGTSTATNTNGSITSQVRANASAGFSIVTWTGNATSGATVGHGLNSSLGLYIIKNRDTTTNWIAFGDAIDQTGADGVLILNSTAARSTSASSTASNSTTFPLSGFGDVNGNNNNMLAYCFAPVSGYSSFGVYTGNGSADGPFVFTGFRPRWILIKRTDAAASWVLHDTERSTYNVSGAELLPNDSGAEYTYTRLDFLSNGFKARTTEAASNTSGATYVYAAFAEHPFKTARAR